jgi:hypothetical protein
MIVLKKIIDPSLEKLGTRAETEVMADLYDYAEKYANKLLLEFELTTAFWEHPVKFEKLINITKDNIEVAVATDDEIYGYVNNGTRPHLIPKGNLPYPLRFKVGGRAKTTPGMIPSGRGAKGTKQVYAKSVHHPGTKARDFDGLIQKRWDKTFAYNAQRAIDKAIRKAGLD